MRHPDRRLFLQNSNALAAALLLPVGISTGNSVPRNPPIRIGQIGTSHAHAAGKLAALHKYPDVFDVAGVVEPDESRRKQLSATAAYRDVKWLTEAELFGLEGLQAVAVETDIEQLLPTAERCVRSGMHIHLDKPAGTDLSHFRRVCADADASGLLIQLGYMYRSNPAFRFTFEAVKSGLLGDVFQIHCEMSKKISAASRAPLTEFVGGSMFELGCHLIDAVVHILGEPDSVSSFHRMTHPDEDRLRDNCLSVLEYPRATASVRTSLVEVGGHRRRQFVVCGTKGTIVIQPLEPPQLSLTLESDVPDFRGLKLNQGTHDVMLPKSPGRYDEELLHFAAAIRGEVSPAFSTKHDLAVQSALLRASEMPAV